MCPRFQMSLAFLALQQYLAAFGAVVDLMQQVIFTEILYKDASFVCFEGIILLL